MGWLAVLLALTCFLACWSVPARAQSGKSATVSQLKLEQADDGVYLNAQVQFELPNLVEEVLEKGIAIYFVAEAELYRERWYWTDQKVAQAARHMRLAYQPLTRRWRLNVSPVPITNSGFGVSLNQNFDTLPEALDGVRRVARLRLGDISEIGDEGLHPVTFRFRLDTSQLPRPFQIGVVGQADWNISVERSARLPLEKAK
ncbi:MULTISPECIES: DUF4390 domain-containing protein [unclassified Variovorax]|uniref:DUF4390 domain-containing protein n=1 Tax=unclassified Variovorax TaxID=663243 RepID=UPI00076DBBA4|nr:MULTISPECIES: DUF4390 domain-containing protein [unclassified Variovorax]KWT70122.1 putative proline rich signal peptide protein [Variovorax sp. WDL1]PNG51832.1 hypothetical protein CHC06_04955 [Variovorax sp. B2]PNG54179.1 hypothetical protein CHC07_04004 [Variovorax sp. B4]VTV11662.1 hypothetical protein WDL1CHR_02523 [Variovorax sp. WDL1]